jgi:hypothetical protein
MLLNNKLITFSIILFHIKSTIKASDTEFLTENDFIIYDHRNGTPFMYTIPNMPKMIDSDQREEFLKLFKECLQDLYNNDFNYLNIHLTNVYYYSEEPLARKIEECIISPKDLID